ncbi:MAG: N-6 DNA methylase, partial [Anaerolineales bacterium]|nr:N-6 DNA methylase [Anaerolineales bacterium]
MPKAKKTKVLSAQAKTTPQHLASIIKSARDKMRKDKGLSGDTDRLPQLTWILFLKFLDDAETLRQTEAELAGQAFRPAIEAPYRWRDWAAPADGLTGDDLIRFINQDELEREDKTKYAGLFAYLKSLRGADGGDRRDIIANVFRGTLNRMINGYILREVLTVVNQINFASSEEIHTLSALYESMLKEMRDAAGDAGEFYTPRAVVRFMVEALDPRLGETVLDPACGTGGFLVGAYEHLHKQCVSVEDFVTLQKQSVRGVEAKPLPYLLCQMNLLLHGMEYPQIAYENALAVRLGDIGDRDRVDVILTNPPFGGEEERGILNNFPVDLQTTETSLLFLQLIMRRLKRGGRCALVLSDGTLSTPGVVADVRKFLIENFNLHTIIRLPKGLFVPYTPIATNLLFFDNSEPTGKIWYYEVPPPTDRKIYTKTKPFQYEEFAECQKWWVDRKENEHSWCVDVINVTNNGYDLDIPNPNAPSDISHVAPFEIITGIDKRYSQLSQNIKAIKNALSQDLFNNKVDALVEMSNFLSQRKEFIKIN